jgi:hypothetical protein
VILRPPIRTAHSLQQQEINMLDALSCATDVKPLFREKDRTSMVRSEAS